jgi:hypothetical protein
LYTIVESSAKADITTKARHILDFMIKDKYLKGFGILIAAVMNVPPSD